jgi:3-oxoacyl-[acyl-carrier-protein] synthase II
VAARAALADGGVAIGPENRHAVGVVVGTGAGPLESIESFTRGILAEGPAAANPATFPNTVYNAAGGQVAMHLGAVGPASTVTAGHAAGAAALCTGAEIVARGRADAVIVVAVDALTAAVIDGYRALGLLTGDFAIAEAGVALLLESRSAALRRGAAIYGELRGHAVACDGLGVAGIDPAGGAAERAMRQALGRTERARVWANACGHRVADAAEAAAIARVFAGGARIETPKRLLAEPIGAGGAVNAALALLAFRHGEPEPALVNSASLGGTHVSLLLTPHDPR